MHKSFLFSQRCYIMNNHTWIKLCDWCIWCRKRIICHYIKVCYHEKPQKSHITYWYKFIKCWILSQYAFILLWKDCKRKHFSPLSFWKFCSEGTSIENRPRTEGPTELCKDDLVEQQLKDEFAHITKCLRWILGYHMTLRNSK